MLTELWLSQEEGNFASKCHVCRSIHKHAVESLRNIHTSMQELIDSKQFILRRLDGLLNQAFLYG